MFQWLNGYDLSLLQYVNKYFGDLITDDLIEDGLKLVNTIVIGSYYNLGCDNIIIETKPICFQKYMHRIIKFNGDDYYIEGGDPDPTSVKRIYKENRCKGDVFINLEDGKHTCEKCLKDYYGDEWDRDTMEKAKSIKHFLRINDVNPILDVCPGSNYHYYESDDYEDEEGETIVFENGYMKVYFRYNPKGSSLILNKREYDYHNMNVYIPKGYNILL